MKSILLTVLILSSVGINFAQDDVVYVRVDKPKKTRSNSDRMVDLYNVYKFDPVRLFVGEIKFGYERRIADKSSIEFELGPTLSNIQAPVNFDIHSSSGTTTSKLGFTGSVALRYYPLDENLALNRFYVSPKFNYRNFNNEFITVTNPGVVNNGYQNYAQFTFNFGVQTWIANNFAIDYYAGLGLGSRSSKSYYYSQVYDYNTQQYVTQESIAHTVDNYWVFTMGVKFGIGQ